VPLLRTHSVPPTHDLFLKLPLVCPKSSSNNSPTLMLYELVGSGMKEKLSMFVSMDSPWREYRSRESPAGVVVDVLGIRILHLANLQCGRWRLTSMSGSGRSRNYGLCRKKKKLTRLYFWCDHWVKSWKPSMSRRMLAGNCRVQDVYPTESLSGQLPDSDVTME